MEPGLMIFFCCWGDGWGGACSAAFFVCLAIALGLAWFYISSARSPLSFLFKDGYFWVDSYYSFFNWRDLPLLLMAGLYDTSNIGLLDGPLGFSACWTYCVSTYLCISSANLGSTLIVSVLVVLELPPPIFNSLAFNLKFKILLYFLEWIWNLWLNS